MKRIILALAALASLSACDPLDRVGSAGDVVAKADITLEKVQAKYDQAKAFAELLVPFLSAARVSQIRAIEARVEAALDLARNAIDAADRLAHLEAAQAATGELDSAAP